jgi:hypothetical protein
MRQGNEDNSGSTPSFSFERELGATIRDLSFQGPIHLTLEGIREETERRLTSPMEGTLFSR